MSNDTQMRAAMQAYIDAFNRDDLEALVALYADTATIEDPVGTPVRSGREEIRAFYAKALKTGARLRLSAPIRTSHGRSAAMAFEVRLTMPDGPATIHVIDVMSFDDAGRFTSMKAYWGPSDLVPDTD